MPIPSVMFSFNDLALIDAVSAAAASMIKRSTIAKGNHAWSDGMFDFARSLRQHPSLIQLEAEDVANAVEDALTTVYQYKGDIDPWASLSVLASRDRFVANWRQIRYFDMFTDPLAEAARRTDNEYEYITDRTLFLARNQARYRRLISIACHLQEIVRPGRPIALPIERLGDVLNVTHQRVSAMREMLIRHAIVDLFDHYKSSRFGKGRAASYIVIADYWRVSRV